MAWTKSKTAVVAAIVVVLAAGTTIITVKELQEHKTYSWEVPKAAFGLFYKTPAQIEIVPTKFSTNGQWVCDSGRGAMGIAQPLKDIIQIAYMKDNLRTVIVTDLPSEKYDFFAKLSDKSDSEEPPSWATALQKMITKKFGVKGHLEMRATDVLLLQYRNRDVQGFKPADSLRKSMKLREGTAIRPANGQFAAFNQPLSTLNSFLERRLNSPIVDRTGLTNEYDFILKWDEPDSKQPNPEGLRQSLGDQLGLELISTNMPIEMLVVDKANR